MKKLWLPWQPIENNSENLLQNPWMDLNIIHIYMGNTDHDLHCLLNTSCFKIVKTNPINS